MSKRQMVLLTYSPRSDSGLRGYEAWLRKVDTPFFNSVPGVARYSNWKLVRGDLGIDWTYFDFLLLEDGVALETVWGNQDLAKFAAGWNDLWGRAAQSPDLSVNYQVHMTEVSNPERLNTAQLVAIVLSPDLKALPDNAVILTVTDKILGSSVDGQIAVVPLELTKGDYSPSWGKTICIAECVASPD